MHHLHITAGHEYWSHGGTYINDIAGEDGGIDFFYPPFDCKVVKIENRNNGNSVTFQSLEKVKIPKFDYPVDVCFRCTHANGLSFTDSANNPVDEGSIFYKDGGKYCYLEGTSGQADGNHIHVEFALGTYIETVNVKPCRYMRTNVADSKLYLHEAVYIKPGTVVIKNDPKQDYYVNQYVLTLSTGEKGTVWDFAENGTISSVQMVLSGSAARIRNDVLGTELTIVPKGGRIQVIDMYDWKAADGYRWCWGVGNGVTGAFQYDPAVMYPLGSPNPNHNNLWMKVFSGNAPMHNTPAGVQNGIVAYTGTEIKILRFVDANWFYGELAGQTGYFLYAKSNMFPHGNC